MFWLKIRDYILTKEENKMLHIGICDDAIEARRTIFNLCEEYFKENTMKHEYVFFNSGETVLLYCEGIDNAQIDILFLDVEMQGISGIDLKKEVSWQDKIARIVFVTNHNESIYNTFSKKTIGFIPKPPSQEKIKKMLLITLEELEENIALKIKDYDGKITEIYMEDIVFLKASGSYTEIYTKGLGGGSGEFILSTRKMGDLEKELRTYPIMRVHKSYMVNIASVIDFGEKILLQDLAMEIPVGRTYREKARVKYLQYVKNRIKKRL